MNKARIEELKKTAKTYAPHTLCVVLGAAVTALATKEYYNPKGKIGMQLPSGLLDEMRERDQPIVVHSNKGDFILKLITEDTK